MKTYSGYFGEFNALLLALEILPLTLQRCWGIRRLRGLQLCSDVASKLNNRHSKDIDCLLAIGFVVVSAVNS